jgi:transcriptional regulator with XRE-family HTH domain
MKKIPQYIIDKAIELRIKNKMTVPEIAECLGYSKATVNGWMENYPLEGRTAKQGNAQIAAAKANRENAAKKRQEAYDEGWQQAPELFKDPEFRDFICMYLGEGTKKTRNSVAIANSSAEVMLLAHFWIQKFRNTERGIDYSVQIHVDQDEEEVKAYWANLMGITPEMVVIIRKSNSGQLNGRKFRSEWGVFTIRANDTYFMAKIYAWLDYLKKQWLDRVTKK